MSQPSTGRRPSQPTSITKPRLLIVEGPDEVRFFSAFLRWLSVEDVQVISMNGKDNLTGLLRLIPATPGYDQVTSITVFRDADEDADCAFESVCGSLGTAQLPRPAIPLTATTGSTPSVTVVIVPPHQKTGDLERLLMASVQTDPAMPCVGQFFGCLETSGTNASDHPSKARLQVFMASRPVFKRLVGEAADAGVWPFASTVFDPIRNVLKGA